MDETTAPYFYDQDLLNRFNVDYPELRNNRDDGKTKCKQRRNLRNREINKKKSTSAPKSYVISQKPNRPLRLVKILVYDMSETNNLNIDYVREDSAVLSAQYVVTETIDEVMDQTESLINKISKMLTNSIL